MQPEDFHYPLTVVWRHKRENLKKCSLRGLEQRSDFRFFCYPVDQLPVLDGYVLLTLGAPPLTASDAYRGLFLLDATWRYAAVMRQQLGEQEKGMLARSLPTNGMRTAYPRRQADCSDPEQGLASAEALYLAYKTLGRDVTGLLDHYHWRDLFLSQMTQ